MPPLEPLGADADVASGVTSARKSVATQPVPLGVETFTQWWPPLAVGSESTLTAVPFFSVVRMEPPVPNAG